MSLQDLIILNQKCEEYEAEIEKLKQELKSERECVDFYGNKENWFSHLGYKAYGSTIGRCIDKDDISDLNGGKLARETQKNRKVII